MSGLSLQQVLSSRFRTSGEADKVTVTLMGSLGLSTKAHVARLAIGRSLALGSLESDGVDARGLEIPATSLFTQKDVGVWVGLVSTHARVHGQTLIDSMESFRAALRGHWHRGAMLLLEDWRIAGENFDRFLETLVVRRAELPDITPTKPGNKAEQPPPDVPKDLTTQLVRALADIGVTAEVRGFVHGPRVTRYRVFLPDVNQHTKLQRGLPKLGLALNLQHTRPSIGPGDEAKTVSLDVPRPNKTWEVVPFAKLQDWLASEPLDDRLVVYPGVDVLGNPYGFDLAAAPHLLVGGTTGSGKSICIHALVLSLLLRFSPSALQLALIDPKQVEFSIYRKCAHLYGDGVSFDASSARDRILDLVAEMETRYQTFNSVGVTNITEARQRGMALPQIVVFIEELADLVLQDKAIEEHIVRLAQKARAAGIHLVLATQRPDSETFSGLVRSNIPARIALTVQKSTESKIILDDTGAELLLGTGDMLVKARPGGDPDRVHGVMVSKADIEAVLRERSA